MSRVTYATLAPPRDSLELASLASSSPSRAESSRSSSPSGISSSRKLSLEDPLHDGDVESRPRPTGHGRSYSVSSAFDFASNLFPLSTTAAGYSVVGASGGVVNDPSNASLEKHKSLTYLNGLSLIVSLIIGSGIFSSPAQVSLNAGSYGAALIVWFVAGILAWTGAASFAELGGAIPLNGGQQTYLAKIYGDFTGFLFTWCAVFVLKPGSAAIISIIFGEYVVRAIVGADEDSISPWINKGVAFVGLALVTIINCISTKLGTRMNDVLMFLKFFALTGITVTGIVVAVTGYTFKGAANDDWKSKNWFLDTSTDVSSWAVAVYAAVFAYDGWDNSNYVVGEFLHPHRDLPRVIHSAMPIVITFYLAASLAYIFVLPQAVITSSNTVATKFGDAVFGRIGSLVLALMVGGSCFGALNASTFTSGRLVYAAGKEGFLPGFLGQIGMPGFGHSNSGNTNAANTNESVARLQSQPGKLKRGLARLAGASEQGLGFTPINAMVFNSVLTLAYVIVGDFGMLVTFSGVAAYSFYFLTVLGLIVLRVKEPYLERPYRTWITTPIVFCCVSIFLLSRAVFAKPLQVVVVVAFIAAGGPVYFFKVRNSKRGRRKKEGEGGPWWKFWRRWGRG